MDSEPHGAVTWGIGLGKVLDSTRVVSAATLAEELGYDQIWVSNERFHRDMFAALGAVAMRTNRVRLGSFVADPYTVHPLVTAAAIATVDELSDGRAILGLAAGGSGFPQMGVEGSKPLANVREALRASRRLLAGESIEAEAPAFVIRDACLSTSPRPRLPLVIASQSPKILELGGAEADAVMISTFADATLFGRAMSWASDGAKRAGRELDPAQQVIARIDVSIDDDPQTARDALRPLLGYLLVLLHPRWWFVDALGIEMPDELDELAQAKDFAGMQGRLELIPDSLIDALGWTGSPAQVAVGVGRLLDLGVRHITVLPHAQDGQVERVMRRFAEDVIPRVEATLR